MSITINFYERPDGKVKQIEVTKIEPDDEQWFKEHAVRLSMEEVPGFGFACYADIGLRDDDGEPFECVELSGSRTCEATLTALRKQCESAKNGA